MVSRLSWGTAAILAGVLASPFLAPPIAMAQEAQIIVQGPAANTRGERVPYHDLNLATRDGERALILRVSNAIERVCLHDEGRWYGLAEPDYLSCTERSWRGARPQVVGAVFRARQLAYRQR